ncbi:MAG: M36 family metallopeptidase [Planctomycetota bacterium]|nr:M36 family metallopeptidase [Planctomycetota bacterium]
MAIRTKARNKNKSQGQASGRRKSRHMFLEQLEQRCLMSTTPTGFGIGSNPDPAGQYGDRVTYLPPQQDLVNYGGFVSAARTGTPLEVAVGVLHEQTRSLGLTAADLDHYIVTDQYSSPDTGITQIYLHQLHNGLEVINADVNVNVMPDGRVLSVGSSFVAGLRDATSPVSFQPSLSAVQAFQSLGSDLGWTFPSTPSVVSRQGDLQQSTVLAAGGISAENVTAHLVYAPTAVGVDLAWQINVQMVDAAHWQNGQAHWYDATVSAVGGQVLNLSDWVDNASYNVFPLPTENPNDAGGSRTITVNPQDALASPYGWHDTNGVPGSEYTDTRGNNVSAQVDWQAIGDETPATRPNGGVNLNFNDPLDLTQQPSQYALAATDNLFYWNNILHDVHYRYGFTEAAGNFQNNNYGRGGSGADRVIAGTQFGANVGLVDNAFMATPPDGQQPLIAMFQWDLTNPWRDGDLESTIFVHEFGHGVSNRLTGGPANANALNALQSGGMGEGWSDFYSLMFTQKPTDGKLDAYPVGTYVLGEPTNGSGIRRYPYSFDMSIDPLTLGNYNGGFPNNEVHNAGELWASVLWDINWLLIDRHGYSSDLYNGNAGNNLALQLIMDGMKLQPANPSFLDARDAILAADVALTGGYNQYDLWTAFARRGWGLSASTPGANSGVVVEAFDMPNISPPPPPVPPKPTPPAREVLAVGPQLIAARPNDGALLLHGENSTPLIVAPSELQLLFRGDANIDGSQTNLTQGIRLTRQGTDGQFDFASAKTDFGTAGAVVVKFEAVQLGQTEDGITVTFTKSDHGNNDRAPTVSVLGKLVQVDLNAQTNAETTATELLATLAADPAASRLIHATVTGNTALPLTVYVAQPASLRSDFNTGTNPPAAGQATLEFTAVTAGAAGNAIQLVVTESDHANDSMAPTISVGGTNIYVDLNTQTGYHTLAYQLVTALNEHPYAGMLVRAQIVTGSLVADLAAPTINYLPLQLAGGRNGLAPIQLAGAGVAEATESFKVPNLEVLFRAVTPGPTGNDIQITVLAANLGLNKAPTVSVAGHKITVTLNSNTQTPRLTARYLVDAINAAPAAAALVQASIPLGDPAASLALATPALVKLAGADEVITPGYVGLGQTSSELLVRFAETLPDDVYRLEVFGTDYANLGIQALRSDTGVSFTPNQAGDDRDVIDFELNLAPQISSVVPQPVTRRIQVSVKTLPADGNFQLIFQGERTSNLNVYDLQHPPVNGSSEQIIQAALEALGQIEPGEIQVTKSTDLALKNSLAWELSFFGRYVNLPLSSLLSDESVVDIRYLAKVSQAADQVLVYFNKDDLAPASAENATFYRLVDTAGTAQTSDDTIRVPRRVAYYPDRDLAVLTFDDDFLPVQVDVFRQGGLGTNEIQLVSFVQAPAAGAFTLSYPGSGTQVTADIPYNATANAVQTALEGLPGLSGNVRVTGDAGGPWVIEFQGTLAGQDMALLVGDGANLRLAGTPYQLPQGTYRLDIGSSTESNNVVSSAVELGTLFDTTQVDYLGYLGDYTGRDNHVADVDLYRFDAGNAWLTGTSPSLATSTVSNGTDSEVQLLTVGGLTGSLTLTYNGVAATSTLSAPYTGLTVAQVAAHLNTIPALNGNVAVLGSNGGPFSLVFLNALAGANVSPLGTVLGAGTTAVVSTTTDGGSRHERQQLTFGGTIASGSFTLTYGANLTTGSIAWSATPSTLVNNIQAKLDGIFGAGNTVVAAQTGSLVTITFTGQWADANLAQLTATPTLTGSSPTLTVSTLSQGGANEVQTVALAGLVAGTMTLSYQGSSASFPLSFVPGISPTAAEVLAHLDSIPALTGNVSVLGAPAGPFTVVFRNALGGANVSALQAATTVGVMSTMATLANFTGGANEVQRLQFGSSPSGVFTLTYGTNLTTAPILYDATPAVLATNIQAALDLLLGAGNTVVGVSSGTDFLVTFTGNLAGANLAGASLAPLTASLLSGGGTLSVSWVQDGRGNEVQQLTLAGLGGSSVLLSYNGVNATSAFNNPYNSLTAADVQARLDTIPALQGNVTVIGAVGGPFTIVFRQALAGADVSLLDTVASGGATPTVTPVANGGGDNEVQQLSFGGTIAGGAFPLAYGGSLPLGMVDWSATPSALVNNLQTVLDQSLGAGNTVVAWQSGQVVTISFTGALARADLQQLTTAAVTITVTPKDPAFDVAVRLLDANGLPIAGGTRTDGGAGGADSLTYAGIAGPLYVEVSSTARTGAYHLAIHVSGVAVDSSDVNSTFSAATSLGQLGITGQTIQAKIEPQSSLLLPQYPGSEDEPGHRQIQAEQHISFPAPGGYDVGVALVAPNTIAVREYNFQHVIGEFPLGSGNYLYNLITDEEKQGAREGFEILGSVLGIQFVETLDAGTTIAKGDLRAADPTVTNGPGGVAGLGGPGLVVVDGQEGWKSSVFGGDFFTTLFHEMGHALGLGHDYDLPALMGAGLPNDVFPGDQDIVHGQRVWRPDANDIDLYRFDVPAAGTVRAETMAERLAAPNYSYLNTVLTLFDSTGQIIARNDDYYGTDSFVELALEPGVYYIGVTSKGNTNYDPNVPNTGFGGTTDGPYQLQLGFTPSGDTALRDATGMALDGNADGRAGGPFHFWFQSSDDTILVDKSRSLIPTVAEGTGTASDPYDSIASAIADAATRIPTPAGGSSSLQDGDTFTVQIGTKSYVFEFDVRNDGVRSGRSAVPVPQNEIQRLAFTGTPLTGTFTLGFGATAPTTTNPLPYYADAAWVQAELESLGGINPGDIAVTGGPLDVRPIDIEFTGRFAKTHAPAIRLTDGTNAGLHVTWGASVAVAIRNAVNLLAPPSSPIAALTPSGTAVKLTSVTRVDLSGTPSILSASNVVRVVGNAGADNDPDTAADNKAYLIGTDNRNVALEDGNGVLVPQGVTLMIDEGALLKLHKANIDAGTSAVNLDRRAGAVQILGTPDFPVLFRSYRDDTVGGNTDPTDVGAQPGDWGGLVFRDDSDLESAGIFLNWVNHADLKQGGGKVVVSSVEKAFAPLHLVTARPTLAFNTITYAAGAAISANPNSFDDVGGRIGPDVHANVVTNNSVNGLFVRIDTALGASLDTLDIQARFDDRDIVHVISENLEITGNAGGPTRVNQMQRLTLSGKPTAGTFTIRVGSATTAALPYDASAEVIQAALTEIGITVLDARVLEVGGFDVGTTVDLVFGGVYAGLNAPTVTVDTSLLQPAGVGIGVSILRNAAADQARISGRLAIDPGLVVKLNEARIETQRGSANLIAEGLPGYPIVFTSTADDRYGIGGTFDTNNDDRLGANEKQPAAGDWGGLIFNHVSHGSLEQVLVTHAGGNVPIEGGFDNFNAIEIHQADVRIAHSVVETNAAGAAATTRHGRGSNAATSIYVDGAQPVIVDNIIQSNGGSAISINANSLTSNLRNDPGRSTGAVQALAAVGDNHGPLVRLNRLGQNDLNGMVVRAEELTTESVWDDTDIVHVVQGEIAINNLHTYGGLRLQSSATESLVVKLFGANAGFTANGIPLEIADRIGGTIQILGTVGHPVVLTALADDTVGAGFQPDGRPQLDTNNNGSQTSSTTLPTQPDVPNGTLIDNNVAAAIPGHFQVRPAAGGDIGFASFGSQDGVTAQGTSQLWQNASWIFDFLNYVDLGSNGAAIDLKTTTISQAPTLIAPDRVASAGTFNGPNGPVTWRAETYLNSGVATVFNTITLTSAATLGNIRFISYLDEDVVSPGGDYLYTVGTPGQPDFRAYTIDNTERVGFSQGGIYQAGPLLANATFDGWAADEYSFLKMAITGRGTTYSLAGNINLANLPVYSDPELGTVYGGALGTDVTTAFAWTVNPNATTATLTSFLDLVPQNPSMQGGQWRSVKLDRFSNDRNVAVTNELEATYASRDVNGIPETAEVLGKLAPDEKSGDENRRLGFEVHGFIGPENPTDQDVYAFAAVPGTEVWLDLDRTGSTLDSALELIDRDGTVLAASLGPTAADLSGLANPVAENPLLGGDFYTLNPRDAGMRVVLPPSDELNDEGQATYFVRVRSDGPQVVDTPLTSLQFHDNGEAGDTITLSSVEPGETFLNPQKPFQPGQRLFIRGSNDGVVNNDGAYTITAVTATTLTLSPQDHLTNQFAPNGSTLRAALTSGAYQLQVRLQQVDEHPGSTVHYADIRYATNGLEILGLPAHSPLLGETAEVNDASNNFGGAQNLGDLLTTDRAAISVGGQLSTATDVDWYQFEVDQEMIQSIAGVNSGGKVIGATLDIDYADGAPGPDTTMAVYNAAGQLLFISRESNRLPRVHHPG